MDEDLFELYIDDKLIASYINIENIWIFVKAYQEKYYNEQSIHIIINKMERIEKSCKRVEEL